MKGERGAKQSVDLYERCHSKEARANLEQAHQSAVSGRKKRRRKRTFVYGCTDHKPERGKRESPLWIFIPLEQRHQGTFERTEKECFPSLREVIHTTIFIDRERALDLTKHHQ